MTCGFCSGSGFERVLDRLGRPCVADCRCEIGQARVRARADAARAADIAADAKAQRSAKYSRNVQEGRRKTAC